MITRLWRKCSNGKPYSSWGIYTIHMNQVFSFDSACLLVKRVTLLELICIDRLQGEGESNYSDQRFRTCSLILDSRFILFYLFKTEKHVKSGISLFHSSIDPFNGSMCPEVSPSTMGFEWALVCMWVYSDDQGEFSYIRLNSQQKLGRTSFWVDCFIWKNNIQYTIHAKDGFLILFFFG